ncbi:MAG: DUF3604 domain-containing protein, partial [Bryobacteraceae bacterium]
EATAILKLEWGLGAAGPRQIRGSIGASQGEVVALWGSHFAKLDRTLSKTEWEFNTRSFSPRGELFGNQEKAPPGATILPNGVFAAVKSPDSATLTVKTNTGDFSFRLAELRSAGRLEFLDGDVAVSITPAVHHLTRGEASSHDFPSLAVSGDDLVLSWVTFQNDANAVQVARRRAGKWTVERVTPWGDYYASAAAAGRDGRITVVFCEYKQDRWRLVSRSLEAGTGNWSAEQYVAPAGRRQMFPRMAADASGAVWVTWQEFASGNFDIYAASYAGAAWVSPIKLSESPRNDWHPAIAAAPDGAVYIAWDGYDAGNYDVFLRAIRNGKPEPLVRVTRSPRFEAHVSIAADAGSRLWLAWEESAENWGKDTGVLGNSGTSLHQSREIRLVRYTDGKFSEPARPLRTALPAWLATMDEYPQVAIGGDGLPYIFFRHYMHRLPAAEHQLAVRIGDRSQTLQPWYDYVRQMWDIFVVGFDGKDWLPVRQLPESTGRCYMQTAAARMGAKLVYAWPNDGRTHADPRVKSAQIQFAEFEMNAKPAVDGMRPYEEAASYILPAAPTETADLRRIRDYRWKGAPELRLYRGDLHRHTDISADGMSDGDILDAYRYAMDSASLDFLAVTDHSGHQRLNYYRYDWWRNKQIATLFNNPGSFVTFFAYERTVTYPGGHRNVISTRRNMEPFPISDEEFTGAESYGERLFPNLKVNGDIAIPHTTGTGGGTSWRENDPEAEPVVEIFQGLRGSYEEPGTPIKGVGQTGAAGHRDGLVWNAWSKGLKLGVIASSDHQSTHQSYACVYAPELTWRQFTEDSSSAGRLPPPTTSL